MSVLYFAASHFAAPYFEPLTRGSGYVANMALPNVLPAPTALMDMLRKGHVDEEFARKCLLLQGVDLPTAAHDGYSKFSGAWKYYLDSLQPQFSVDDANRLWYARRLSDAGYDTMLHRVGISDKWRKDFVKLLHRRPLPLPELVGLMRRDRIVRDDVYRDLAESGYSNQNEADNLIDLLDHVPSVSDLIRFMTFRSDEDQFATDLGLDTEFDARFRGRIATWAKWLGVDAEVLKRYWRGHWRMPSVAEAVQMRNRLRPEVIQDYQVEVPGVRTFTDTDLQVVLASSEIAPGYRDQLQAVSRPVIGVRQLRNLIKYSEWEVADVARTFRDQGYSDSDSAELGLAYWKAAKADDQGPLITESRAQITRMLQSGLISEDNARALLAQHGMDGLEIDAAVANITLDVQVKHAEQLISGVKKMFLAGALSVEVMEGQLGLIGVNIQGVARYSAEWQLELQAGRKHIAVGESLNLLREHLISEDECYLRILNLGYDINDAQTMVLAVGRKMQVDALAQATASLQTAEERAKLAIQRVERADKEARAARAELSRHGSPSKILQWVKKCIITQEDALARLVALGWPEDDAIRDIESAGKGYCPPSPPKPPSGGGSGTVVVPPGGITVISGA